MGVDRTDYLVYGVKLSGDAFDWDRHEDALNGAPGAAFDVIHDGMSGKYTVAGKIIARSGPYEGFEFIELTRDLTPKNDKALAKSLSAAFDTTIRQSDLRMLLFTHFH